jgi:hypothetical protein
MKLPPLKKPSAFSSKRLAFLAVAGLCVVVGLGLRAVSYFGESEEAKPAPTAIPAPLPPAAQPPAVEATEPAPKAPEPVPKASLPPAQEAVTTPDEASEAPGATARQGNEAGEDGASPQQAMPSDRGMILVSRRPIEMLAGPSASASVMYGFPAGRPFRVIGHDGGFVQIQDLKSSASGWIDEAALAPPPRMPETAAPSQAKPAATSGKASADAKSKAPSKDGRVATGSGPADQSAPAEAPRRPGLFGGGGLFGGLFGNRN